MFTKPFRQKVGEMRIVVDRDRCLYCGACVAACPPDAIYLRNGALTIDDQTCTDCERCVRMCPVGALTAQTLAPTRVSPAAAAPNGLNGHAAQR